MTLHIWWQRRGWGGLIELACCNTTTCWHAIWTGHQRRSNCHQQRLPTRSRSHVLIIERITYPTVPTIRFENYIGERSKTGGIWNERDLQTPTTLSWTAWIMYGCIISGIRKSITITVWCIIQTQILTVTQSSKTMASKFGKYNN
jgi:hypothetical protein